MMIDLSRIMTVLRVTFTRWNHIQYTMMMFCQHLFNHKCLLVVMKPSNVRWEINLLHALKYLLPITTVTSTCSTVM